MATTTLIESPAMVRFQSGVRTDVTPSALTRGAANTRANPTFASGV